jgi:hypothetical protein
LISSVPLSVPLTAANLIQIVCTSSSGITEIVSMAIEIVVAVGLQQRWREVTQPVAPSRWASRQGFQSPLLTVPYKLQHQDMPTTSFEKKKSVDYLVPSTFSARILQESLQQIGLTIFSRK